MIERLQQWYASQCDGDWEHQHGISIETLDNPGWAVKINLEWTELEEKPLEAVKIDRSEHEWVHCRVREGHFEGYGGPHNLEEILEQFFRWADQE